MTTAPMFVPQFFVKQKLTMMVNRYEITSPEGQVLAMAQQKRMAFKEQVTFFADEARTQPVFGFKARQAMDLGAGYDVFDGEGTPIGHFRKDFGKSLLRSSFHLSGPGLEAFGQERSQAIALIRRFVDIPLSFHFDFVDNTTGAPVLSSERGFSLRDRYTVTVHDPRVDFRLAAAMAVGLDALLAR